MIVDLNNIMDVVQDDLFGDNKTKCCVRGINSFKILMRIS